VANAKLDPVQTEDTITLAVQWLNLEDGSTGHALYTSSWIAPKSDVHSQQHWHYMGQTGEVHVDQVWTPVRVPACVNVEGATTHRECVRACLPGSPRVHHGNGRCWLRSAFELHALSPQESLRLKQRPIAGNCNPLFWKPAPTNGKFSAQRCYGYISVRG
jgi:hypothetical protein